MQKIFYTSDLHFSHNNIIGFDGRPFISAEEMENELISRWNNKVSQGDIVYILGDFCWNKNLEHWKKLLNKLNGSKHLIVGNHDNNKIFNNLDKCLVTISDIKEIKDAGRKVIMCHYPIMCYKHDYSKDCFMLYGHVHTTQEFIDTLQITKHIRDRKKENPYDMSLNCGNIFPVGCMLYDFYPQTLDEIIEKFDGIFEKWGNKNEQSLFS